MPLPTAPTDGVVSSPHRHLRLFACTLVGGTLLSAGGRSCRSLTGLTSMRCPPTGPPPIPSTPAPATVSGHRRPRCGKSACCAQCLGMMGAARSATAAPLRRPTRREHATPCASSALPLVPAPGHAKHQPAAQPQASASSAAAVKRSCCARHQLRHRTLFRLLQGTRASTSRLPWPTGWPRRKCRRTMCWQALPARVHAAHSRHWGGACAAANRPLLRRQSSTGHRV